MNHLIRNGEDILLDPSEDIKLAFRGRLARPDIQKNIRFRSMSLEHTRVTSAAEYAFEWLGRHHYLALHDIVMEDGEMNVEGMPAAPGGDLRNKMTYVPAGRPLSGWSRTARRQNSFTILHFDPVMLSEETERVFGDDDGQPLIYFDNPALLVTMKKLEAVIAEGEEHSRVYLETLALLGALELAQARRGIVLSEDRVGRLSGSQETLLRDYVDSNLASDISLDDLGQLVRLSRFHLARRFKATFGSPPHRYVTERRIERAKRLLLETTLSVGDIAVATGFSTSGLLIRAFRASTGTTPLAFRRR